MYKQTSFSGGLINTDNTYEAKSLMCQLRKITEEQTPIEETAPIIYTNKKDGVLKEYDIKTDRFEVAMEAMGKMRSAELTELAKSESAAKLETAKEAATGTVEEGQ